MNCLTKYFGSNLSYPEYSGSDVLYEVIEAGSFKYCEKYKHCQVTPCSDKETTFQKDHDFFLLKSKHQSAYKIKESEILKVSSIITNTGDYDGHEVVQLYIHDKVGSITRPIKELKGFKKIFLRKGESKTVSFEISSDDLKFYNSGKLMIESGEFEIAISGTSDFEFNKTFKLTLN